MKIRKLLFFSLLACCTSFAQEYEWAVIDVSVNYMREKPSYTAELGTQALMGTMVRVLDKEGYWIRISTPDGYEAWTNEMGLAFKTAEEKSEYAAAEKWICTADYSAVRELPSSASQRVSDLVMGDLLLKCGEPQCGWVPVKLPGGRKGWVESAELQDYSTWATSRDGSPDSITALACSFTGIPYLWGGSSVKGFDCSGLVQFVFYMNGILLPRNASQQAAMGEPVQPHLSTMKKGDLIFYGNGRASHVAIYLGDGRIVHSSQIVRISSLKRGDPDYYDRDILCVRRINRKNCVYLPN